MKVLQAMAGARHGGAEAFFMRLAPALSRAGLDQYVLIRQHAERQFALADAGIRHRALRFGGPLDLLSRWRFRQTVATERPDTVLTWMSRATDLCPPVRMHVARLGGYYDLKHYRRCDHLIANTQGIARWLREQGWPDERVHYLPNFVDAVPAAPAPRPEQPVVMALGRLHRNKAFDVLLAALAQVPAARLWLFGEGPEADNLLTLAQDHGILDRVDFRPWVEDPAPYYAAADLVVVPSRIEPLGNVVLEAWAHGKPLVAAASDGPRELIEDGATGLLVPMEDADALAGAIKRVLASPDLAATLAESGQAVYRARFTEAAVVDGYLDLFRRLA